MSRKKKTPPSGPNMGYLVSFGDTMTALLAFFIVLVSMAEEQTGADLYSGTGSFSKALKGFGVPGQFQSGRSDQTYQRNEPGPLYVVDDPDVPENPSGAGPDKEKNAIRTIDREQEDFQRFLNEWDYKFGIKEQARETHSVVIDLFDRLDVKGKLIPDSAETVLADAIVSSISNDSTIEIIVWANVPSPTVIRKVSVLAKRMLDYTQETYQLTDEQHSRISAFGKPWLFSDAKRPAMSIVLSKRK